MRWIRVYNVGDLEVATYKDFVINDKKPFRVNFLVKYREAVNGFLSCEFESEEARDLYFHGVDEKECKRFLDKSEAAILANERRANSKLYLPKDYGKSL